MRSSNVTFVLYGRETRSFILGEEHDWGCLKTKCWGEYLDFKGEEVTQELRKLHNEELQKMYCSSNIVRLIKQRRMELA